jgi:hypothetical protein
MKKAVLWIGGVIIILAAVYGGYQVIFVDDKDGDQAATEGVETGEHSNAGATKTACDIFTDAVAAKVLGSGAMQSELPAGASASTDDVSVTNCLYEIDDPDSEGILTASVLVRGGKTDAGKSSNEFGFDNNKKIDAQGGQTGTSEPISGIGDAAYFSPAFGQVNVLVDEGTYWLIVQGDTRAKTEQLAKLLVGQL